MKSYVFIIALLLFLPCNLSAQRADSVKKSSPPNEWTITKKEHKDKSIGKTKDGKIIYEGPRGGRYYISDKGKKVYIKKN
jgi:colicin import membrane protein